ncbi:MAG: hypothetical protein OXC01_13005 [Immundisolibacterales bacterium]|nr:hypothetical protein [Immundisolibacterales bacterium]
MSISDASVVEGETAEFVVTLSPSSARAATVSYTTQDGTARAGEDYRGVSGTLRFAPGKRTRTIRVATTRDAMIEPAEEFTVRLRGAVGATIADGLGVGTISDDLERRADLVTRTLLPVAGRALAFSSFRCRVDRMFSNLNPVADLSSGLPAPSLGFNGSAWDAKDLDGPVREQVLRDWSFLLSSREQAGGTDRPSLWGCGDYVSLNGDGHSGVTTWDGEALNVEFGVDAELGPTALAGVSISRSRTLVDYLTDGTGGDTGGELDLALTGIHPYFAWSLTRNVDVWGTAGRAWGDFGISEDIAGERRSSEATLDLGAAGVVGRLPGWKDTTVALKGEFVVARLDVAGAGTDLGAQALNMHRLRTSAEASYDHLLSSGGKLTSWGELGLRLDGGDGETGAGLELGSGMRFRNPDTGWSAESHSRMLAFHEDGSLREWGIGGQVRLDPGAFGRGPSVTLARSWGRSAQEASRPWDFGTTEPFRRNALAERLDAELAYGFAMPGSSGVLTPFGAMSLYGANERLLRLGGRLGSTGTASVRLELQRRERSGHDPVHAISVFVRARF